MNEEQKEILENLNLEAVDTDDLLNCIAQTPELNNLTVFDLVQWFGEG